MRTSDTPLPNGTSIRCHVVDTSYILPTHRLHSVRIVIWNLLSNSESRRLKGPPDLEAQKQCQSSLVTCLPNCRVASDKADWIGLNCSWKKKIFIDWNLKKFHFSVVCSVVRYYEVRNCQICHKTIVRPSLVQSWPFKAIKRFFPIDLELRRPGGIGGRRAAASTEKLKLFSYSLHYQTGTGTIKNERH